MAVSELLPAIAYSAQPLTRHAEPGRCASTASAR